MLISRPSHCQSGWSYGSCPQRWKDTRWRLGCVVSVSPTWQGHPRQWRRDAPRISMAGWQVSHQRTLEKQRVLHWPPGVAGLFHWPTVECPATMPPGLLLKGPVSTSVAHNHGWTQVTVPGEQIFYLGPYWRNCPQLSKEHSRELDEPRQSLSPVLWLFVFVLGFEYVADTRPVSFCCQTWDIFCLNTV